MKRNLSYTRQKVKEMTNTLLNAVLSQFLHTVICTVYSYRTVYCSDMLISTLQDIFGK